MKKAFVLVLLMSGAVCVAQSTLRTPSSDVDQNQEDVRANGNGAASPQNVGPQGYYPAGAIPDLNRNANEFPLQPNQVAPIGNINRSSRIVGPLRTKSEFQQYAEDTTGRQLPVYGRKLFDQVPSTFAPIENTPVPGDYVLGPDDQLLIRAWGKIELNSRVTIDRNGQINLPRVGTLTVAGLHYSQVEPYVKSAIGALFKDFDLNVTLGQLRAIQIYVLGNARQPGAYTVSALSTLVDALFASGGPSATGTMRDIQLRRDGKTISDFDLYDLIAKGDKSKDVRLLPGDVIFIPAIGPQVAISGDVNRPGIYELKDSTTAGAEIATAGGMTSLASVERAVLERIEDHSRRIVEEFPLDSQGQARELKDGDILRVFPLSPKFTNAVTLRGNVAVPGLYPWKEGMRISDLIPSREALITRDYWNQQNHLVRPIAQRPFSTQSPGGYGMQNPSMNGGLDRGGNRRFRGNVQSLQDGESPDFDDNNYPGQDRGIGTDQGPYQNDRYDTNGGNSYQESQGSLRGSELDSSNNRQDQLQNQGISVIGKNSAEINWEYALIERLDERDLSTHLIPFRLASAIDDPKSPDNQLLKPGDVVTIFSRADLELPMDKHATFVRIAGEVNAPGIYRVNPGETLRDVVKKAGGLTQHSYLYASIFTRVSTRRAQETELRQFTEQMQRDLVTKYANASPQAGQSADDQQAQLALQQAALSRLTAIKPTGRVVLTMRPDASSIADIPDFPLEDGDTYYIPPRLSTVQVAGAVYNPNAFRYEPRERLISYLNAAGGATRNADAKRMYVIRADGSVISRQSRGWHSHGKYENLRLLPGDAVVVPEKLRVSSKMNQFLQWTQLSSQLALTSAAINVIR
jgi:protein involved in polysaccharide export with SLBB domain